MITVTAQPATQFMPLDTASPMSRINNMNMACAQLHTWHVHNYAHEYS